MQRYKYLFTPLVMTFILMISGCGMGNSSTSKSPVNGGTGTNGACGSSDGAALSAAPTVGLCSAGTATPVSGTGPWTWSCVGADGGSTAACSATKASVSAICSYRSSLPDGCPGAPAGTPQLPHLLDVQKVTSLNILGGSGYTNGTYTWTTSGGGGSGANGTVTVAGGALGGTYGLQFTVSNYGSGYTSRPTIAVPAGAGAGSGGSITPTVYQATPHNASTSWNMPGVDYHVGIPSGTVLRDPTTSGILPTGATYSAYGSGGFLTVTGCNVTLDAFDFTLHNTVLVLNVTGSNCTTIVQNSKQNALPNTLTNSPAAEITKLGAVGTFIYKNNEYDGLAPYGQLNGSGFFVNAAMLDVTQNEVHNIILSYNYFHNFDAKIIQVNGSNVGTSTLIEKYNLFSNFGSCNNCSHGEAEYMYSDSNGLLAYTGQFNTYVLPMYNSGNTNLTAPHAVMGSGLTINGVTDDHNVILAQGPQGTCAANNSFPYVAAAAVFDGATGIANSFMQNVSFDHNYVDNSGTYFPWYHMGVGANVTNTTWTNNVDTGTGNACN